MTELFIDYKYPENIFQLKRFIDDGYIIIESKHSSEFEYAFTFWQVILDVIKSQHPIIETIFHKGCIRVSKPEPENELL